MKKLIVSVIGSMLMLTTISLYADCNSLDGRNFGRLSSNDPRCITKSEFPDSILATKIGMTHEKPS